MHQAKYRFLLTCLTTTTLGSLCGGTVVGEEAWARFRGPNGTGSGVSAVFPVKWTDDDLNWRVELPGKGHSSPIIWGDYVILQSADEENTEHHVLCFNGSNGRLVWKRSFPADKYQIHNKNSFASASPTVDDERAYVAWSTSEVATLAALNKRGDTVWEKDLGHFVARHGFGSSPIIYEDMVVLPCLQHNGVPQGQPGDDSRPETSFVIALDRKTGTEIWRTTRLSSDSASYSAPCMFNQRGRWEIICCSTANGMFSLDPTSGEQNWSIDVFEMRTVSSPVVADGLLIGSTGSGAGGNYVVAVAAPTDESSTPREVYRVSTQAPYVPTPVPDGELMYLWSDKGIVTCVEAKTGEVVWRERVGGNYSGSPILVNDRLIGTSEDGEVVVLAAGREYKLLGRSELGGPSNSTPAVGHGRIYFRTYSHLISLGGKAST